MTLFLAILVVFCVAFGLIYAIRHHYGDYVADSWGTRLSIAILSYFVFVITTSVLG